MCIYDVCYDRLQHGKPQDDAGCPSESLRTHQISVVPLQVQVQEVVRHVPKLEVHEVGRIDLHLRLPCFLCTKFQVTVSEQDLSYRQLSVATRFTLIYNSFQAGNSRAVISSFATSFTGCSRSAEDSDGVQREVARLQELVGLAALTTRCSSCSKYRKVPKHCAHWVCLLGQAAAVAGH